MGTLHARTLDQLPDVEVTAVCNHTPDKARRLGSEIDTRWHTDLDEFLREELDAVWVATPDFAHRDIAIAVLESGKHLFLEKALATSLEDGHAILAAAVARPELKAMVGYPLRFDPCYQRMRAVLNEHNAGTPIMTWSLRTHFLDKHQLIYDKYRDEHYHAPAWYFRDKGPVYSHASHDYDLLRWLCGEIESVFVYGDSYRLDADEVADAFVMALRFENGAVATVSTPWVTRVEHDYVGVATRDLTVVNINGEIHVRRAEGELETTDFTEADMWTPMAKHFITCVREDQPPLISIADGLRAIEIAEASIQSMDERREVTVRPV